MESAGSLTRLTHVARRSWTTAVATAGAEASSGQVVRARIT